MHVRSLRLTKIKAFDALALDFGRTDKIGAAAYAGMNFFVGGNASGKSTLLKSPAMALSGPSVAQQQIVSAFWFDTLPHLPTIDARLDSRSERVADWAGASVHFMYFRKAPGDARQLPEEEARAMDERRASGERHFSHAANAISFPRVSCTPKPRAGR